MKSKTSLFVRLFGYVRMHKIISSIVIILIVVIGYYSYKHFFPTAVIPQYTVAAVHTGNIIQTVTGTGQVSAEYQTDVKSQVSGTILSIPVSVGQHVHKGDLLATVDPTNAAISLKNAQIAYQKLVEPAKASDLQNATNNLNSAYTSGYNSVTSAFIDLPDIMSGLKDMLYGQTGFLSNQHSTYLIPSARTMRDAAGMSYDKATTEYTAILTEYQSINRTSSTSTIEQLMADTHTLLKNVATTLQLTQNTVTYITTYQPDYNPKDSTTASTDVNSWSGTVNSDLNSIVSSQNTIASDKNTLENLIVGADPLDVASQQLSLEQAQQSYDNYFIRAPFDGIVAKIPVNVYDQASGATIATIIGDQKVADISLNEVDAAKVVAGQPVTITFDAIDGLTATGTVQSVDQVGTVSSGVVSYGVRIAINTPDQRIKSGMSVNVTITTLEKDSVLIVPSAAIKTRGRENYVQTLDRNTVLSLSGINTAQVNTNTQRFGVTGSSTSSSTRTYTGALGGNRMNGSTGYAAATGATRSLTVSTDISPTDTVVTTGISDDTNTEITNGLEAGEFVITKTSTTGGSQTSSAPSILNSFGNRGGAVRMQRGG